MADFRESIVQALSSDSEGEWLILFFYAVTLSGWETLREPVLDWLGARNGRTAILYVGTDHGITDPEAIWKIHQAGLKVRMMQDHTGVFHPKLVWLASPVRNRLWAGSNNLTRDGLLNNIEFALHLDVGNSTKTLKAWATGVHEGSVPVTDDLLKSYRYERKEFEEARAEAGASTFTWSKKKERRRPPSLRDKAQATYPPARHGALVVQIMPRETRGGNQIQLPKGATKEFLGLKAPGDTKFIKLAHRGSAVYRDLVISVFKNRTVRLSLNELEQGDRPCVVVLTKVRGNRLSFDIVSESIFPSLYRRLLAACDRQTSPSSRRWTILKADVS